MLLKPTEIESVLKESLPNVPVKDIQHAVQALEKASSEWQEVNLTESLGAMVSVQCRDICALGEAYQSGCSIRAFIKKLSKG